MPIHPHCMKKLASKAGRLRFADLPARDTLSALRGISETHQEDCRLCDATDQDLARLMRWVYEQPQQPWLAGWDRLNYIMDNAESSDEVLALHALCCCANLDGEIFPALRQDDLAHACRRSKPKLVQALKNLESRGIITTEQGKQGTGTRYTLNYQTQEDQQEEQSVS